MSKITRDYKAECAAWRRDFIKQEKIHAKRMAAACTDIAAYKFKLELKERELAEREKAKNSAYSERNKLVAALSGLYPASLERHEGEAWEDDWRWVVYIDLPAQVSWHIHDSELPLFAHLPRLQGRKWDGHSTEEKYERLAKIVVDIIPFEPSAPDMELLRSIQVHTDAIFDAMAIKTKDPQP